MLGFTLHSCISDNKVLDLHNSPFMYYGTTSTDAGMEGVETIDSGFVITGLTFSESFGQEDIIVAKFDKNQKVEWSFIIGSDSTDVGNQIVQNSSGEYILTGYTNSFGHDRHDAFCIKLNSNGELIWSRVFGGYNYDYGTSIELDENRILIGGYTYSYGSGEDDMYCVEFNDQGDSIRTDIVGGERNEHVYDIISFHDSTILLTGFTKSFGDPAYDIYLNCLADSDGLLWSKVVAGPGYDSPIRLLEENQGGLYIGGGTSQHKGDTTDIFLIKINQLFEIEWAYTYGTQKIEMLADMHVDLENNIILTGWIGSENDKDNLMLLIDKEGNLIENRIWGTEHEEMVYGSAFTEDQKLITVGKAIEMKGGPFSANISIIDADMCFLKSQMNFLQKKAQFEIKSVNSEHSAGIEFKPHSFKIKKFNSKLWTNCNLKE